MALFSRLYQGEEMTELETFKQRIKGGCLGELEQERLINYFSPIYYVEFEELPAGELFPRIMRVGFYDKRRAKHDALAVFEREEAAKRVIEKSMLSGREKIIKERA